MVKRKVLIVGMVLIFATLLITATELYQDLDMMGNDVHNATNVNSTNLFQDGNSVLDTSDESWVDESGDTMSGDLNMDNNNVTNVDCITFESGGEICSA